MASLTSTAPSLPLHRAAPRRRSAWPADWRLRRLIGLAFASPYVVLAVLAYAHGFSDSSNATLDRTSSAIHWGSGDLSFVGHVYPPIPSVVASLLPNAMALGIAGAVAAGQMLEALVCRLAGAGWSVPAAVVLTACFGCSPSFALTATTDLSAFMALTFLVLAFDGFVRFVFLGQTHGGFQAGLAIGVAGLCDPAAVVFAIGFAVSAPLVARNRYRAERAVARATAGVLLFPTIAGILGWVFLCWRFTGSPLGWLHTAAPSLWSEAGSLHLLVAGLKAVGRPLLFTPVFVLALALLIWRNRTTSALGICLPLGCMVVARWIGLPFSGLSVAIVLGAVGLASLPGRPGRRLALLCVGVAVAGLALKWSYPPSGVLLAWEHALG